MDQPKVVRLLRVMQLLARTTYHSVDEIAALVECSDRTVYRYIESLRDAGFAIVKREGTIFQLVEPPKGGADPRQYVCFTDEEAAVLGRLIQCLDGSNPQREVLLRKITAIYDAAELHKMTIHHGLDRVLDNLQKAFDGHRVVIFHRYASACAGEYRDYTVEPFKMDVNCVNVAALDLRSGHNKIFKVARIGEVEVLPETWTREKEHAYPKLDVFRMSGEKAIHVRIALTLRARNLLLEEYPLSEAHITEVNGRWIFDTNVMRLEGIGRFVMGLLDQVEILEGDALWDYVQERCRVGLARPASSILKLSKIDKTQGYLCNQNG